MSNTTAVECRECEGTGEGFGRPCGGCRGRGERVVPVEHDGSLCAMEADLEAQASIADADVPAMPWERSYEVSTRATSILAGNDLADMLERDGLRCAAALLRLWVGGNRAAAGAMDAVLADVRDAAVASGSARCHVYASAVQMLRDGDADIAVGQVDALKALSSFGRTAAQVAA